MLYGKSSRADHLCFVRFLFVPLLCSLFVHIHIRKLCKVLHFLRPTHMQQHGVTVGQLAPTDHADVMDVSRKNVDNATAETDSRKPGSVEPVGCTGDSKVSPKQTVDGNGDTKPGPKEVTTASGKGGSGSKSPEKEVFVPAPPPATNAWTKRMQVSRSVVKSGAESADADDIPSTARTRSPTQGHKVT